MLVVRNLSRSRSSSCGTAGSLQAAEGAHNEMQADNPWAMLLRTILPWVNVGQAPDYSQQEDADGQDSSHSHGDQGQQQDAHIAATDDDEDDLD